MPICPQCLTRFPDGAERCATDGVALVPDAAYAHVDRDLEPGAVVGEYRVEGKIGEGGFGAVYAAVHPVIGKRAAVKVLSRELSSSPGMVSRFIAEARAVNQIRHRNIIDIFSFGQLPDGRQYYVMELLEGTTFDRHLDRVGRLTLDAALPILRGIARALDAAHAKNLLHRDLKPENVFLVVDEDGRVEPKLLDFGLVKLLGPGGAQHKTKTGTPMGTPLYMSPEQCSGEDVDARTDVYAFGVMVFQVLTGTLPFDGDTAVGILVKHMTKAPPPASSLGAPPALDAPIARMLAKEPAERPATVGLALEELMTAARQAGLSVAPAAPPSDVVVSVGDRGPGEGDGAHARTVLDASGPQTFLGAESDVRPPRRHASPRLLGLLGAVALLGAVGVTAAAVLRAPSSRARPDAPSAAAAPSAPAGTPSSSVAAAPSAPSPAVGPEGPRTVELRVDGAPQGATVAVDGRELGLAPGPFTLAPGAPVVVTVTADGYKPKEQRITPARDVVLTVSLARAAAPPSRPGPRRPTISRDLEGF